MMSMGQQHILLSSSLLLLLLLLLTNNLSNCVAADTTTSMATETTTTTESESESDAQQQQQQQQQRTTTYYIPGASGSGPFEALKDWIAAFEAKFPEADLSVSSVGSGAAQAALWGDINCEKKPVEGLCPLEDEGEDEDDEDEGVVDASDNLVAEASSSGDDDDQEEEKTTPVATLWGMGGGTIDDELYIEHSKRGLQQLPALGGPILLTYSKDVTGDLGSKTSTQLNLSFETVAGIFSNKITRWNDTAIQIDNPTLVENLPNERITVVVRSDKSGMTQTLTEAIHHANPNTWPDDGVGKKPDWPLKNLTHSSESGAIISAGAYNTINDDDDDDDLPLNFKADGQTGIGISLLRRPYSIGYLELGYFSTLTQFVGQAYMSSPAHPTSYVPATVDTLKTTMGGLADQLEPDTLSLTLVDQDTPLGGYPISRYVYWYIKKDPREYSSCYQAWLVYKFIEWTYTDPLAEEIALGHGWVVPPESVVDIALSKLREMQCILKTDEEDAVVVPGGGGALSAAITAGAAMPPPPPPDESNNNVTMQANQKLIYVADYIPSPYREPVVVVHIEDEDSMNLVPVLVPTIVVALLIAAAIMGYVHIQEKKRIADSVWMVEKSELDFGPTITCIGQGTFGMVLLATYRGTKVAVKQVIPIDPTSKGNILDSGYYNSGCYNDVTDMITDSYGNNYEGGEALCDEEDQKQQGNKAAASMMMKKINGNGKHTGYISQDPGYNLTESLNEYDSINPGLRSAGINKTLSSHDAVKNATKLSSLRSRGGFSFVGPFKKLRRYRQLKADFVLEMRHLAKLRHPNITTTMGAVLSPGEEPMLVMEYMHNGSLYDAIRNETIDLNSHEDILTIVQDIAHGLRFLHSATPQVIHGDLKTKNVLIDANFRAKVADFGLSAKTDLGARGTPYWMAPELLTETSTNNSMSDIYSFGILLYEVYSRKNPYEGEDYRDVLRNICDPAICKRPPVPALCPPSVAKLMKDCLLMNPEVRPTAEEIDTTFQAQGTVQGRVFRIEALNRQLAESNKRISDEQATQLSHFASMSHEIRTPLNCIIGISSLLEEDPELNTCQKDSINMIVSSGKLLRHVVDDVLDFSKFISGNAEIDIKRTDLQETLATIITSMNLSPITERKQISIQTFYDSQVPQYVETDGRRLQQIMYNLLSNAIKFSRENGMVDLSVYVVLVNDKPELRINVKDYGKGIDKSEFDKIFQPFQQTESGINNADGGTGLGLAITRQLCELLGGTITVDSKLGEWTDFSVHLPLTGNAVNTNYIASRLSKCCIWLVANKASEVQCTIEACRYFNIQCLPIENLTAVASGLGRFGTDSFIACLVQEDLYDDASYVALSKKVKSVLLTFGPSGKISLSKAHYQSLMQVFPSVLMQQIINLCGDKSPSTNRLSVSERSATSYASDSGVSIGYEELKVLVAEDNKVNQKVLVRLLNRIGVMDVQVAENGQVAVDLEAKEEFDVIFLDIQMPVLDGIEACKRVLARHDNNKKIAPKIVFLSAHVMEDYTSMCIENGATDYMTKPCTLQDLRGKIENLTTPGYYCHD